MAKALLEWETLDAEQVNDIMQGRPPRPPKVPAGASTPPTPPGGEQGVVAPHPAA
jgi:cell division protease FtsH